MNRVFSIFEAPIEAPLKRRKFASLLLYESYRKFLNVPTSKTLEPRQGLDDIKGLAASSGLNRLT